MSPKKRGATLVYVYQSGFLRLMATGLRRFRYGWRVLSSASGAGRDANEVSTTFDKRPRQASVAGNEGKCFFVLTWRISSHHLTHRRSSLCVHVDLFEQAPRNARQQARYPIVHSLAPEFQDPHTPHAATGRSEEHEESSNRNGRSQPRLGWELFTNSSFSRQHQHSFIILTRAARREQAESRQAW
jgi:hypothetical protein